MSSSGRKKGIKFLKGIGLLLIAVFLGGCDKLVVLNSKGTVGAEEALLIKIAFALMLIVVIPVFVMVIWFSIRYRATNTKATYKPNWTHSTTIGWVVWMVPVAIIAVLAYITWESTHQLNPYKPLESDAKPIRIDVISTDSDWLFVYPEYHVAVINQLVFPVNVPLNFRLTSSSVMTSFFIPALGSQMYSMAGMQTRLHLMANEVGVFTGKNMEYSGNGYAGMHFKAISTTSAGFENWLNEARQSPDSLNMERFRKISMMFNINHPVTTFSAVDPQLFNKVMGEYMQWMGTPDREMKMDGMEGEDTGGHMHMMHGHGTSHKD